MFRAVGDSINSEVKKVKNKIVKFKDGLDMELAPLAKIQDCLDILNKAYALNNASLFALKASGATVCAGAGVSLVSQQNSRFGLFGKVVAFGATLFGAAILLEREIRPLSAALPEDKLNRILNVSKELRLNFTKDSQLGLVLNYFQACESYLIERQEASKSLLSKKG